MGEFRGILRYPRFKSGQIHYSDKEDVYRSNSVLESYNNHIKNELPRSPNWPQFLEFIQKEDKKYSDDAILAELRGKVYQKSNNFGKGFKPILSKKRKRNDFETPTPKKNESNVEERPPYVNSLKKFKMPSDVSLSWLKWEKNSCWYDSFLTLFAFSPGNTRRAISNNFGFEFIFEPDRSFSILIENF